MPDQKISQLTAGGAAQATDEIPIARSGTNVKVTAADIGRGMTLAAIAATGASTVTPLDVSVDGAFVFRSIPTGTLSGAAGQGAFRFTSRTPHSQSVEIDPRGTGAGGLILGVNRFHSSLTFAFRDATNSANQAIVALAATLSGQSLTGSAADSLVDLAATWNTTGTPTALKLNVTDTASNAASRLFDLQIGGNSRLWVRKDGIVFLSSGGWISQPSGNFIDIGGSGLFPGSSRFRINNETLIVAAGGGLTWNSSGGDVSGTNDLVLARDAADTLAQRRTTNAQTFRLYNSFLDASNYDRAKFAWESNVLRIGTEKAGSYLTARALELQTDGTTRATISTAGLTTLTFDTAQITSGLIVRGSNAVNYWTLGTDLTSNNSTVVLTGGTTGLVNVGAGMLHLTHSGTTDSRINSFNNLIIQPGGVAGGSASSVVEQRNGVNAQTFRLYTRYDTASDFRRLTLTSATYSGVEYNQILAETGGTYAASNVGIVLSPKGTGAFTLQMPDGTTAGGNARGTRAVDLQLARTAATQVASGEVSVAMGERCTASGYNSIAIGRSTSTASHAVAFGDGNNATGFASFAAGQYSTASSTYATIFGYYGTASGTASFAGGAFASADKYGQVAFGLTNAAGSTSSSAQWSVLGFRGETTTASATEIFLHGVSNTRATVPASTTWMAEVDVIARSTGGTDNACFQRRCIIKRDGANNTALVGTVQTIGTDIGSNAGAPPTGWAVTVTADDTNESLKLEVTGAASTTIRWVAKVSLVEVGLA